MLAIFFRFSFLWPSPISKFYTYPSISNEPLAPHSRVQGAAVKGALKHVKM